VRPGVDKIIVPLDKIVRYLLNDEHPVGGPKARFFKQIGFGASEPQGLAQALVAQAETGAAVRQVRGQWELWRVRGPLIAPNGRSYMITSVWRRYADNDTFVLVTAFPGRD
jgi:hypothetical protein